MSEAEKHWAGIVAQVSEMWAKAANRAMDELFKDIMKVKFNKTEQCWGIWAVSDWLHNSETGKLMKFYSKQAALKVLTYLA